MSAFRSFGRKPFRAQGLNVADVKLMQSSRVMCYISYISLLRAWKLDHASVNTQPSDQRQMGSTKSDFTSVVECNVAECSVVGCSVVGCSGV